MAGAGERSDGVRSLATLSGRHEHVLILVILTLKLVVFAIDIPLLLALSVARYRQVSQPAEE